MNYVKIHRNVAVITFIARGWGDGRKNIEVILVLKILTSLNWSILMMKKTQLHFLTSDQIETFTNLWNIAASLHHL